MSEADQESSTQISDSEVAHEEFSNIREEVKPGEKIDFRNRLMQALEDRKDDNLITRQAEKIVTAEREAERYREVSRIDPLTGILNRRGFEEKIAKQLAKGVCGLVLMIDADHFKELNDTYGHSVGDEILKRIGLSLQTNTQLSRDIVARLGGDEFIAFLTVSNPDLEDRLYGIVERVRMGMVKYLAEIRHEVNRSDRIEEVLIPVTLSVGATLTKPGDTLAIACKRADDNLYKAKNSGSNRSFSDNGEITLTPVLPPDDLPEMPSS